MPPRPSTLTVSSTISGPFVSLEEYPYVAAVADGGHHLLLRASPNHGVTAYYVLDVLCGTATPLPLPSAPLMAGCVGIVANSAAEYLVVCVQLGGPAGSRLRRYDSLMGEWAAALPVDVPGFGGQRQWAGHGLVAHGRTIVAVDLSQGFVWFDLDSEEAEFVPLPAGRGVPAGTAGLERVRCAALCHGRLCYAELVKFDAPLPQVHVLALCEFDEQGRAWSREGAVALDALWDGMELPTDRVPAIALIHPHPHVNAVYVTLDNIIYAVDLRSGGVVGQASFQLQAPPAQLLSSHFLRGWMQPA